LFVTERPLYCLLHAVRIRAITDIQDGRVNWETVPYCSCSDENRGTYDLQPGDIVFARTGATTGKSYLISTCPDAAFASYLIRLRPRTALITPRYFSMFLKTSLYWSQIMTLRKGSAQPGVNARILARLRVPLAPLPEQNRIVAEIEKQFSRLDAGVAALKRAQSNLKRYRAAVLQAARTGRLVPTEAELARAERRDYETAEQFLARIRAERYDRRQASQAARMRTRSDSYRHDGAEIACSGLPNSDSANTGTLPEGWIWTNLAELKEFSLYGPRFSSDMYSTTGRLVLRTSDISDSGRVNLETTPRMPLVDSEFQRYKVEQGDLLITRSGSIGTVALFNDSVDAIAGAYLIQYRLPVPPETSQFIFCVLKSPTGRQRLVQGSAGVGRPNLNAPTIDSIPIPIPPLTEQHRIVVEVERRLSIIDKTEALVVANLKRAQRLRQAILKRAFEGKLVPQDPSDEPASVLLERIRAERAAVAANGAERRARRGAASSSAGAQKGGSHTGANRTARQRVLDL
jgi:type I restriction enzyme S subunit